MDGMNGWLVGWLAINLWMFVSICVDVSLTKRQIHIVLSLDIVFVCSKKKIFFFFAPELKMARLTTVSSQ